MHFFDIFSPGISVDNFHERNKYRVDSVAKDKAPTMTPNIYDTPDRT